MLTTKDILDKTNGGMKVFQDMIGNDVDLSKSFHNPFREDHIKSCKLYKRKKHDGTPYWYMKDFGDSAWCGDCFYIYARRNGMDPSKDLHTILRQLSDGTNMESVSPKLDINKPQLTENKAKTQFSMVPKVYSPTELLFWEQYGITLNILEQYNVKSLSSFTFHHTDKKYETKSSMAAPIFAYDFQSGVKLYLPKHNTRFLYAGKLPSPYVFGLRQVPLGGEYIFITGGEKDVLSLVSHGYSDICFNSETATIPLPILDSLNLKFKNIILLYDADEVGLRESKKQYELLKDRYRIRRLVLPLPGTKSEKDISDFFRLGKEDKLPQLINELLS